MGHERSARALVPLCPFLTITTPTIMDSCRHEVQLKTVFRTDDNQPIWEAAFVGSGHIVQLPPFDRPWRVVEYCDPACDGVGKAVFHTEARQRSNSLP